VTITVGIQLVPQFGDMAPMRERWIEAEELGADILWTCDHFTAMIPVSEDVAQQAVHSDTDRTGKNFEGTTIQAAMAVTTSRARIGCIVHGNSYRNPNLMADVARTIDHLAGGRFIFGIGSGYLQPDYDEYGYEYGTASSRLNDLVRDLPIIKSRLTKLKPPPLGPMPIVIASMGDKIGLRLVAEHADMWQMYGPLDKMARKIEILEQHCADIGRDPAEIEYITSYTPQVLPDTDLDKYVALGFTHFYSVVWGPDWDLGELRELLAWKRSLASNDIAAK
jgi:probable F420-dependent oxidoreductase